MYPIGRHAVGRLYGSQGHYPFVGPLVAHNAHRLYGQQHGTGLPNLVVETTAFESLDKNIIHFLKQSHFFGSYVAQNSNGQAWSRERMAAQNGGRNLQFFAHPADFVLKKELKRLYYLKIHFRW